MPPAGLGEVCGYITDLASFDAYRLITHIISDTTKDYQKTAARAIERALISNQDTIAVSNFINVMSAVLKLPTVKLAKDFNKAVNDVVKAADFVVEESNYRSNYQKQTLKPDELNYLGKMIEGVDFLSEWIDATKLSIEQKAVVAVLVSNYSANLEYVEACIQQANDTGNTEMAEIYGIVRNDLIEYYKAFIEGSARYIVEESLDFVGIEQGVDSAKRIASSVGFKPTMSAYVADTRGQWSKGTRIRVDLLLLVHGILAEKAGSNYDAMQRLYEDAIVIEAMENDLLVALDDYKKMPGNTEYTERLKNKGLILASYRIHTLSDLKEYHKSCLSGKVFLDTDAVAKEELTLNECVNYLSSLEIE